MWLSCACDWHRLWCECGVGEGRMMLLHDSGHTSSSSSSSSKASNAHSWQCHRWCWPTSPCLLRIALSLSCHYRNGNGPSAVPVFGQAVNVELTKHSSFIITARRAARLNRSQPVQCMVRSHDTWRPAMRMRVVRYLYSSGRAVLLNGSLLNGSAPSNMWPVDNLFHLCCCCVHREQRLN